MSIKHKEPSIYKSSKVDKACTDLQYIEDIATAYWQSEVLFASLSLELFKYLEQGISTVEELAHLFSCSPRELFRMLRALEKIELVCRDGAFWFNTQISGEYLVPGKSSYMGDFFLYRKYMQSNWSCLADRLALNTVNTVEKENRNKEQCHTDSSDNTATGDQDSDYRRRNFLYVKAMDSLVRQKGTEISSRLENMELKGPMLDVGGGAGSMIRSIRALHPEIEAVLFDLPEVIEAARNIYPSSDSWNGINTVAGDFRTHLFESSSRFGLVILSNFLHAYGPDEAKEVLVKAIALLESSGLMIIHDYFPDRRGVSPVKGALYDLTMMLNTYNGECHESCTIIQWLDETGLHHHEVTDLDTDSSIIIAAKDPGFLGYHMTSIEEQWVNHALSLGFKDAVSISIDKIVVAPWVRKKCEYGCPNFGQNHQCPPYGMSHYETEDMIRCYHSAVLVEGSPPGKKFHDMLLTLERKAFLDGYHKAFVFGAGPCNVCPSCPEKGGCRRTDLARPSMEGSGIDVYETARIAGITLRPVKQKGQYVKYIGLLLLE